MTSIRRSSDQPFNSFPTTFSSLNSHLSILLFCLSATPPYTPTTRSDVDHIQERKGDGVEGFTVHFFMYDRTVRHRRYGADHRGGWHSTRLFSRRQLTAALPHVPIRQQPTRAARPASRRSSVYGPECRRVDRERDHRLGRHRRDRV